MFKIIMLHLPYSADHDCLANFKNHNPHMVSFKHGPFRAKGQALLNDQNHFHVHSPLPSTC